MIEWYDAFEENIDIDENNREVDILVTSSESGNIYVSLTFEQIKDIAGVIASLP